MGCQATARKEGRKREGHNRAQTSSPSSLSSSLTQQATTVLQRRPSVFPGPPCRPASPLPRSFLVCAFMALFMFFPVMLPSSSPVRVCVFISFCLRYFVYFSLLCFLFFFLLLLSLLISTCFMLLVCFRVAFRGAFLFLFSFFALPFKYLLHACCSFLSHTALNNLASHPPAPHSSLSLFIHHTHRVVFATTLMVW